MSKAEACKESIQDINPFVHAEAVDEYVTGSGDKIENLLDGVDLLFLAWVNLSAFTGKSVASKIHEIAKKKGVKIIEFGGDPQSVYVGPIYYADNDSISLSDVNAMVKKEWFDDVPGDVKKFRDARINEMYDDGNRIVNAWQTSPSLSIMAGMAVDQAVKLISECEPASLTGKRITLSLQSYTLKETFFDQRGK